MENLCYDILSEILIRLPSKNLAQLRCVCKRWNTLLCEAKFIKSHLRCSNINDKDEILLLFNNGDPIEARSSASPDVKLSKFIKFPVNYPYDIEEAQRSNVKYIYEIVIGATNGLVCFYFGSNHVIRVWNPSLSALLSVPQSTIPVPSRGSYCTDFRFGFDAQNDDYKIVKVIRWVDGIWRGLMQVEVYSMRTGCWKLITQRFPFRVSSFRSSLLPVCVDGYIHWHCDNQDSKTETIVAYDLAAESFSEISLPDSKRYDLGVFGGKLCVISRSRDFKNCQVYVLDHEYGSWVNSGFSHFNEGGIISILYGFTLKNHFIFEDGKEVIYLYDPVAPFNKVKPFQKSMKREDLNLPVIIPYVESLVWITPPSPT